jgi:predicted glycoside hydrolase/deacetylase ChbG (UPF0249 family)
VPEPSPDTPHLIITADDWGYSPRYNEGILEAARVGAVDAVSAMVIRSWCDPAPLLACDVEVGLHLELPPDSEQATARQEPRLQAELFETAFGRPPAHIDGHHHCHAVPPLADGAEELAAELGVRVRGVSAAHRDRLRGKGIETPDRLVGRIEPSEPALPAEISSVLEHGNLPYGLTEWIVHPGRPDAERGSAYDSAREEDLAVLLSIGERLSGIRAG